MPRTPKKLSTKDVVVMYLAENKETWFASFDLDGKFFFGHPTGRSGGKRIAEIAPLKKGFLVENEGEYIIKGVTYKIKSRRRQDGCGEYKCTGGKKQIEKVEFYEKDGQRFAKVIKETVNV